jgi:hypothetical protein
MDQSGNNNHLLLRASQPGLPGFNGQHAAADRMRELLARTVQDHLVDGHATASALDEIRRRLDALERALDHVRDVTGLNGGTHAALGTHPGQTLAGIAATLDGLAASMGAIDARVGALDTRLERLSHVNDSIAATDNRIASLAEQSTGALAPLTAEVRSRPDRTEIEEIVTKITESAQRDVIARLASLEEIVLTLAEALLRPAIR